MAKLRGIKRWHRRDVFSELTALEIRLDSLHQKSVVKKRIEVTEAELSYLLGGLRSIIGKVGANQKTLKRWIKPAPNQLKKKGVKKV